MSTSFSDAKAQVQAFLDEAVGVYEREPQQNMKGQRLATVQLLRKIVEILGQVNLTQHAGSVSVDYSTWTPTPGKTNTVTVTAQTPETVTEIYNPAGTVEPEAVGSNPEPVVDPADQAFQPVKRGPGRPRKTPPANTK